VYRFRAMRPPFAGRNPNSRSDLVYRGQVKSQREIRELEALSNGKTLRLDDAVFLSPMGFRWDERNLETLWHKARRASGVRQIRLHDLRHTFASQLIEQGNHPKYIQEQLGHASITMTMDTYGHLFPNRNRGLVDGLDSLEIKWQDATSAQPLDAFDRYTSGTSSLTSCNPIEKLVRPEGLEPPTPRSVVWCSIH
jgi:hypothetical protein